MTTISVLFFGTLGVALRFVSDFFIRSNEYPLATLTVNVVGCFLAGLIVMSQNLSTGMRSALLIGLCGGLTTFSALILQTLQMIRGGDYLKALGYLLVGQVLGLLAAWAGMKVTGN